MLSEEMLDYYLKAGSIASEVRRHIKPLLKEGASVLSICENVEDSIRKRGGEPAFPCNVCINELAAHYSSPPNDAKTIPKDAVIKVDLGVQIEGYIADTALTVSLNPKYENMIYAVNEALEQAIMSVQPKVKINEVGRIIQKTIERYGFKPIKNLSGHQLSRYLLHTGKSIPNIYGLNFQSINEGEVYAVEPFLTLASGRGEVRNAKDSYIYRFKKKRRLFNQDAIKLLTSIKSRYKSLPFSPRWIEKINEKNICEAFDELIAKRCISYYPVLVEASGNIVAQAEHTIIVTKDECIVTTR